MFTSFAKFSNSTIFMSLCTMLLAVGSSVLWQVLCPLQGEQTPSDYPLYRLGSFVKSAEVFLLCLLPSRFCGKALEGQQTKLS